MTISNYLIEIMNQRLLKLNDEYFVTMVKLKINKEKNEFLRLFFSSEDFYHLFIDIDGLNECSLNIVLSITNDPVRSFWHQRGISIRDDNVNRIDRCVRQKEKVRLIFQSSRVFINRLSKITWNRIECSSNFDLIKKSMNLLEIIRVSYSSTLFCINQKWINLFYTNVQWKTKHRSRCQCWFIILD